MELSSTDLRRRTFSPYTQLLPKEKPSTETPPVSRTKELPKIEQATKNNCSSTIVSQKTMLYGMLLTYINSLLYVEEFQIPGKKWGYPDFESSMSDSTPGGYAS